MSATIDDTDSGEAYVTVEFSPDPGFELSFDGMSGTEELGRPFVYYMQMTSGTLKVNVSTLLGSTAAVCLSQSKTTTKEENTKYINAIVTRVISRGLSGGTYRYDLELRPWIWLLSHVVDSQIFQSKSPFDIVTDLFRKAGFSDFEDNRKAQAGNQSLIYCVQYRESTLDFVTRLMEEFGFYYYFKHEKEKHTLVFADDPNAHTELSAEIPFQFDQTEYRAVGDHLWEWAGDFGLNSGKLTFKDYNFGMPSADLSTKRISAGNHTNYNSFEIYEYPGRYFQTTVGDKLVDVRMQAIAAERAVYHGASNCRKLHAGWKFKLSKFPDKPANRDYLVIRSEVSTTIAEGMASSAEEGESLDTYRVMLHAIPGDVPFRLQRRTPRPEIRGPQTAKVMGAAGDEITTDKYGRVKVKFHWDKNEKSDDTCTCWIRVAQGWAGTSWGSIFIPRVGMEVVVEFLEGNPDRPIITGCVYNAVTTVPYTLPDDKTKSTVKTNSSTGGGGFNEFRFEDKKGEEEVYFHAQKDYNKEVLHDETVTITNDTTTTVKEGNRSVTVSKGDDSHTVSTGKRTVTVSTGDDSHTVSTGNRSVTVSTGNHTTTVSTGNHSLSVSVGNHSIDVSVGSSSITALKSITLTSGPSSITIGPSGISMSAPTISLSGTASISLSAAMISIN